MALYKYSSFPFLLLCSLELSWNFIWYGEPSNLSDSWVCSYIHTICFFVWCISVNSWWWHCAQVYAVRGFSDQQCTIFRVRVICWNRHICRLHLCFRRSRSWVTMRCWLFCSWRTSYVAVESCLWSQVNYGIRFSWY